MGVGASVGQIYADARKWFRIYIDKDTYVADFEELNHMGNGGVTFGSVQAWIAKKALAHPDSCWTTFQQSGSAIMMSHKAAATHMDSDSSVASRKVVDISEFKAFLIHLYANTILWTHFIAVAGGDNKSDEENFRKKLNLHEFSLACKTLNDAHAKVPLTKDMLRSDFLLLDENCDGLVGYVQVCAHCCKYIHDGEEFDNTAASRASKEHHDANIKAGKILGISVNKNKSFNGSDSGDVGSVSNVMGEFKTGKAMFAHLSAEEKTTIAMEQVQRKVEKEGKMVTQYLDDRKQKYEDSKIPDSAPHSMQSFNEPADSK